MWNYRKDLLQKLIAQGHHVCVATPSDDSVDSLISLGVDYYELSLDRSSKNPLEIFLLPKKLKRLYSDLQPELIIHYTIKPNVFGAKAAHKLGIPSWIMITGRGYAFSKKGMMQSIASFLYRRASKQAEKVFFLNKDDIDFFVENKITDKQKVIYLPGEGVNCQYFTRETAYPKQQNIYFIGRLLRDKGIELFAEAARTLHSEFPEVRFSILGPLDKDNENAVYMEFVEGLDRQAGLSYLGESKDVKRHLEKASCVVLPSFYEGIPVTLLEAASMELPIITSDTYGCRDVVVDGETGFLVKTRNLEDLVNKLRNFLNLSYSDRQEMGRAGRNFVCNRFSVEKVIEVYEAEIQAKLKS